MAEPNAPGDEKKEEIQNVSSESPDFEGHLDGVDDNTILNEMEALSTQANAPELNAEISLDQDPAQTEPSRDGEEAVMAGLTDNQIGEKATPTNVLQDPANPNNNTQGPNTQSLADESSSNADVYAGNSKEADIKAYNDEMSGAGDRQAGKNFGHGGKDPQQREEERQRNYAFLSSMAGFETIEALAEAVDDLADAYEQLKQEMDEIFDEINEVTLQISERIMALDERIDELKDNPSLSPDEQAELDSLTKLRDTYREINTNISIEANEAATEMDKAGKEILELREKMKNASPEELEALNEKYAQAVEKYKQAETDLQDLKNKANFVAETATFSSDRNLDQAELRSLSAMAGNNEQLQVLARELAQNLIAAGGSITNEDGVKLSGEAAMNYILEQLGEVEQEKVAALTETQQELTAAQLAEQQAKAELQAQQTELDAAASTIEQKLSSNDKDTVASAELATAVVRENMSLITEVIKDREGNEVHIDRSGNFDAFYYINDEGTRVDYDPNDPQVTNFMNGKDGDAPFLSFTPFSQSSQISPLFSGAASHSIEENHAPLMPAVKRFANDDIDFDAAQAMYKKHEATASIAEGEKTLESLSGELQQLRDREGLLKGELEKIDEIERQLQSGEISLQDAQKQMDELQGHQDSTNQDVSEALNVDLPKHSFADMETAKNEIEQRIAALQYSGGILSQEEYNDLSAKIDEYGLQKDLVDGLMAQNKVELEHKPAAPQVIGGAGIKQDIQVTTLDSTSSPILVGGQNTVQSFADTLFQQTNDPNAPTDSFAPVMISNVYQAQDLFKKALEAQPSVGTQAPSPAELGQLKLAQLQQGGPDASNDPMAMQNNTSGQMA